MKVRDYIDNTANFRGGRVSLGLSDHASFGKGCGDCEGVASQDFFDFKAVGYG